MHLDSDSAFRNKRIPKGLPHRTVENQVFEKDDRAGNQRADRQIGSTADQLRDDIDSGRTGTKVDWPDPAAAPLGTDDEAAGTRLDPKMVAETRLRESGPKTPMEGKSGAGWAWLLIAFILALALGSLALGMAIS